MLIFNYLYSIIEIERKGISVENQKFNIEIDGVDKVAEVLKILSIDDREYVIYSVDNGDETSDIFTSEIVKDEEGYDKLIDIEDEKVKQNLLEIINVIFS